MDATDGRRTIFDFLSYADTIKQRKNAQIVNELFMLFYLISLALIEPLNLTFVYGIYIQQVGSIIPFSVGVSVDGGVE